MYVFLISKIKKKDITTYIPNIDGSLNNPLNLGNAPLSINTGIKSSNIPLPVLELCQKLKRKVVTGFVK